MPPVRSRPALLLLAPALSLLLSATAHLGVSSPLLLWMWLNRDAIEDNTGDEGTEDGPVGNGGADVALGEPAPVRVSLYVEPTAAQAEATAEATPGKPPSTAPRPPTTRGAADGDANSAPTALTERFGVEGRRPRGERKPCEPVEEIVKTGDARWRVERDVIDWYATHLHELSKQVAVSTHKNADGRPDGARLYLPRCSILFQAGVKHGDIVHSINDRRVATIPDAIAAYLLLRTNDDLRVEVTRKNGTKLTLRYRIKR